jgi:hypothetical protein
MVSLWSAFAASRSGYGSLLGGGSTRPSGFPKAGRKGPLVGATMELAFNKLGAQGWELVAIEGERATFKREILDLSDAEREELAAVEDEEDERKTLDGG